MTIPPDPGALVTALRALAHEISSWEFLTKHASDSSTQAFVYASELILGKLPDSDATTLRADHDTVASRLGLTADHIVHAHRLSRAEMDEAITVLREGEKRILDLQQELRVLKLASEATTREGAEPDALAALEAAPEQSEQPDLVAAITAVVRDSDRYFERVGGSSRDWVRECFLPKLNAAGLIVMRQTDADDIICRHCNEELRDMDGAWCDRETHSICLGTSRRHQPVAAYRRATRAKETRA